MNHIHSVLRVLVLLSFIATASAQDTITYFHPDATGSPVAATDEHGNLLWREDYAPYGERLRQEVSPRSNRIWFTGHHQDDDSGLIYAGARHYDPVMGRFLTVDPTAVDPQQPFTFNRYLYGNNNPYRYADPDGKSAVAVEVVAVGALIYLGGCQIAGSCEKFGQATWAMLQAGMGRDPIVSRYLTLTGVMNQAEGSGSSNSSGADKGGTAATPPAPDDKAGESTLEPGPYAGDSIPARGPERDFTPGEREKVNEIGKKSGCHTCGSKDPGTKSGNFVPDHQPPNAANPNGEAQRLYPQCLNCSRTQGGEVRQLKPLPRHPNP